MSKDHPTFAEILDRAFWKSVTLVAKPDPRDPDPTKPGIFRYHTCAYCKDGALPCKQHHPHRCEYPRARND